jgi:hypothetical protein
MLRSASRFVLESSGPAPPPSPYPAVTISTQVLDMDMPQLSVSNQGLPAVTDVTLIRIEATQCPDFGCINENQNEDEAEADGPQIESIAILHNFAAASRLHPLSEQSLRRRAVTVTHLAYCLSCRLLQGENYLGRQVEAVVAAHGIGIGPFLEQAMLRVSLLLIRCNYQLCVDLGDCDAAWRSLNMYRAVQTALLDEEGLLAQLIEGASVPHAKAA